MVYNSNVAGSFGVTKHPAFILAINEISNRDVNRGGGGGGNSVIIGDIWWLYNRRQLFESFVLVKHPCVYKSNGNLPTCGVRLSSGRYLCTIGNGGQSIVY